MAFLDNSGDIILDAVLTDTGRMRLAKSDGSFKVTKFALGDDEINYGLYDKNNPNGSAYYDLNILQTPVLEAFTNNMSSLNSKLMSIANPNLLYLPVMKINNIADRAVNTFAGSTIVLNGYIMSADLNTQRILEHSSTSVVSSFSRIGLLNGYDPSTGYRITIDQGIDNENITPVKDLSITSPELVETQYLIEIDNRLGEIVNKEGNTLARKSYIDDDNIAGYYLSSDVDKNFINQIITDIYNPQDNQVIAGARGNRLEFKIKAAIEIATSDYLFKQLGSDVKNKIGTSAVSIINEARSIVTAVTVTGLTTGYSIQIPIVIFKIS